MKSVCFTGHRPPKLGGYDWNSSLNKKFLKVLENRIRILIFEEGYDTFYFGGALGTDQMAFHVTSCLKEKYKLDIKLILAIPFRNFSDNWFMESKSLHEIHLLKADEVVYTDIYYDIESENINLKYQKRNIYMIDSSDKIIAIWDGSSGGTYNAIKYGLKKNKNIFYIKPNLVKSNLFLNCKISYKI